MARRNPIHDRLTAAIDNYLQDPDPARDMMNWGIDLLLRVQKERQGTLLVKFIEQRLGKPDFTWRSEFRFSVWDRPTYRVFANARKGLCLEVPVEFTREDALDAFEQFRKDIGMSIHDLPGSDIATWTEVGRRAVHDHAFSIPRMSKEQLRDFIRCYCDGHIITDRDVPKNMFGMVFLPVSMSSNPEPRTLVQPFLVPVESVDDLIPPQAPIAPKPIPEPVEPNSILPDPEVVQEMERNIHWQVHGDDRLTQYLESIQTANDQAHNDWVIQHTAWEASVEIQAQQWVATNAAYQKEYEAYLILRGNLEAAQEQANTGALRNKVAEAEAFSQYYRDLGLIWGYRRDSLPRGVNGYPMLTACSYMHKADAELAAGAIERELKRRDTPIDL